MSEVETLAVISDLHSNAEALDAVARDLVAEPPSRLVMLGDLFMYGCEPERMLGTLADLSSKLPTTFIVGNHDQLYFDLERGDRTYYDSLPAWIRESVDWHVEHLRGSPDWRAWAWQADYVASKVLISHANPFGPGDWTYLNAPADWARAQRTLDALGYSCGVFGHTHRAMAYPVGEAALDGVARPYAPHAWVANPGSVGQPRSAEGTSSYLRIAVGERHLALDLRRIVYDVGAHLRTIEESSMSSDTKRRLRSFFEKSGSV